MEKNNKKISLTEIILLIVVLVSVILILIDMTMNLKDEINLQSQNNIGDVVLLTATKFIYPELDWIPPLV